MPLIAKQPVWFAVAFLASSSSLGQSIADFQEELLSMRLTDQQGRQEIRQIEEQYGYDSPEWRAAWDNQNAVDLANMERLVDIIDEIGWPIESVVGEDAATGAFLILQHADLTQVIMHVLLTFKSGLYIP